MIRRFRGWNPGDIVRLEPAAAAAWIEAGLAEALPADAPEAAVLISAELAVPARPRGRKR